MHYNVVSLMTVRVKEEVREECPRHCPREML